MKIHTTNYKNTLIETAEDSPVSTSEVASVKRNKTLANIQFEMISEHPYHYTSDDVMFACFAQKNNIAESERANARKDFFAKGQACFRSSALCKRYGFGVHHNADGKVALYPMESKEYADLVNDETVEKIKAMRTKRG